MRTIRPRSHLTNGEAFRFAPRPPPPPPLPDTEAGSPHLAGLYSLAKVVLYHTIVHRALVSQGILLHSKFQLEETGRGKRGVCVCVCVCVCGVVWCGVCVCVCVCVREREREY